MFPLPSMFHDINAGSMQIVSSCSQLLVYGVYGISDLRRNLASSTVVQDSCLPVNYDRALWLLACHLFGSQLPIDSLAPLDKIDIG